jgi:hypothetical protein
MIDHINIEWEYRILNGSALSEDLEKQLTELGSCGWEAFAVQDYTKVFLKRRIDAPSTEQRAWIKDRKIKS